jgi:GDPmannose 4,6-dehydratase
MGSGERLTIGSLSVEKEWTFAGDMARAMWMLVQQDEIWEAVIGSGQAYAVRAWVEACFRTVGIGWQPWVDEVTGYRPDFQRLVSNPSRIRRLGWEPELSFEELAALMVRTQMV